MFRTRHIIVTDTLFFLRLINSSMYVEPTLFDSPYSQIFPEIDTTYEQK